MAGSCWSTWLLFLDWLCHNNLLLGSHGHFGAWLVGQVRARAAAFPTDPKIPLQAVAMSLAWYFRCCLLSTNDTDLVSSFANSV